MADPLPPGPRLPPALQVAGFWTRPLAFLEQCRARHGKRFTLRFPAAPPFVILTTPQDVKQVFTAPADVLLPGSGARVLEPIVGAHSVILLDGEQHMEQRKLMLPAFHGERIARLSDLVAETTTREVARWPQDEPVALHPRLQALTLEVILRAVFGLEAGERLTRLREALGAMLTFGDSPLSLLPPTPAGSLRERVLERVGPMAGFLALQREADAQIFALIDERRREGAEGERDDVLAMLLAARREDGSPMAPQELRDELMTLLVAGHETTASSLAWALEQLARHPAAAARLREEISSGEDAYLTAVIHETLRRRPVLPNAAPRLVAKEIEVGGRTYPTDVCLVANAYLLHHDPDVYPDPYAFRPERFLDRSPGTYTWIPFGGGRRRCLGASFALLEMRMVLHAVLAGRALEPVGSGPEPPQRRSITIRPGRAATLRLPARAREAIAA